MDSRDASGAPAPGAEARVALELPCRPDSPAVARQEMSRLEPELGVGMVARVRVVVNEMVSNCVWNAGGGSILVEVSAEPAMVRGEVAELDPERDSRPPDPSPFRGGGFGRLLVRRLTDRSGALRDRRGMWFEIDRSDRR